MNWGAGAVSPFAPNPSLATAFQQQPPLPFRISVEVEVRHDLLWVFTGDGAMLAQNFPGEHPSH